MEQEIKMVIEDYFSIFPCTMEEWVVINWDGKILDEPILGGGSVGSSFMDMLR